MDLLGGLLPVFNYNEAEIRVSEGIPDDSILQEIHVCLVLLFLDFFFHHESVVCSMLHTCVMFAAVIRVPGVVRMSKSRGKCNEPQRQR